LRLAGGGALDAHVHDRRHHRGGEVGVAFLDLEVAQAGVGRLRALRQRRPDRRRQRAGTDERGHDRAAQQHCPQARRRDTPARRALIQLSHPSISPDARHRSGAACPGTYIGTSRGRGFSRR
jgi:hypothetical protein